MKKAIADFNKAYETDDMFHEYLAFSQFFQRAFISKGGYIIDPSMGKQYGCMIKHLKVGEKNKSFTAVEETLAVAISVGPVKVFKYWVKATEDDIVYLQKKFPAE